MERKAQLFIRRKKKKVENVVWAESRLSSFGVEKKMLHHAKCQARAGLLIGLSYSDVADAPLA